MIKLKSKMDKVELYNKLHDSKESIVELVRQLPEQDYEHAREYIMQRMEDTYAFDPPNRQPPEDAGKPLIPAEIQTRLGAAHWFLTNSTSFSEERLLKCIEHINQIENRVKERHSRN